MENSLIYSENALKAEPEKATHQMAREMANAMFERFELHDRFEVFTELKSRLEERHKLDLQRLSEEADISAKRYESAKMTISY